MGDTLKCLKMFLEISFTFEKVIFLFVIYYRFLPKPFNLALKCIFDYVAIWFLLSRNGFWVT
jgi:hypothetical protein